MAVLINPTIAAPTELRIRSFSERTANGVETDMNKAVIPAGRISSIAVLGAYVDGVWQYDLQAISVADTEAWIEQLASDNDPLAAEAAAKFAAVDDALKWLTALRASQSGLCERPTA